MKPTSLTTIAAIVVIGAVGFMAGRISSSDSAADDGNDAPAETRSARGPASRSGESAGSSTGRARDRKDDPSMAAAVSPTERLARLDSIIRDTNPLDRSRALLAFIDQLGPGEFEEAVAHFRSLGITDSRFGEYALLLSGWAEVDPLAALAYAKDNTGGGFATGTILATWASNDPEGAIQWAETNHTGDGANPYLAGIIRSLGATDPARATDLLAGMPRSRERGDALDAMLPHLITQGADATRAWISGITDDSLRDGAMMRAADKLAAIDPAGTAAWLLANPGDASQRRMDDVYSAWARQDQAAAVGSLATLPAGEQRSDALRGVISSVASENPREAVALMDRYPNDVNDGVVRNLVWHSFGSDPVLAVSQIARIADEGDRNRTYGRLLRSWTERDPAAASNWIQNNPLPQPVQERLNRQ
jgi:hypothetical protein